MEPASCTREKFELYKRYQMEVHGDKESKLTESSFLRFLCDSPLKVRAHVHL
jgi:arginine-tRNA-protein transferase